MGRHSFLDSLKDIGHKIEHTVNNVQSSPIVASIVNVEKSVVSGVVKAAPSVEGALMTVGNEAITQIKKAEQQSADLRNGVKKFGMDAVDKIEKIGGDLFNFMNYIPYIAGGIALVWVYSKVK